MIEKYEKYLDMISPYLQKYFEQQAPYIFCKEGCAICCETGLYPFSEVEFKYAMLEYETLSVEQKKKIQGKVKEIKKAKEEKGQFGEEEFVYECPFLIEKKCSIYKHRGLICRSFGLLYFVEEENGELTNKIPCCVQDNLNYSIVYDSEKKMISAEKYEQSGITVEPLSYNVGVKFLLKNTQTEKLGLELGDQRTLIDWF